MRKFKVGIFGKLQLEISSCIFESLKLLREQNWDEIADNSFIMGLKGNMRLK